MTNSTTTTLSPWTLCRRHLCMTAALLLSMAMLAAAKPTSSKRLDIGQQQLDWAYGGWAPLSQGSSSSMVQFEPLTPSRSAPVPYTTVHSHQSSQLPPKVVPHRYMQPYSRQPVSTLQVPQLSQQSTNNVLAANVISAGGHGGQQGYQQVHHQPYAFIEANAEKPLRVEPKPLKQAQIEAYKVIEQLQASAAKQKAVIEQQARAVDIRIQKAKAAAAATLSHFRTPAMVRSRPRRPQPPPPPPPPQPTPAASHGTTYALPVKDVAKDYVTLPVAVETDEDKVLTQEDINQIEKEVLKSIPETLSSLSEKQLYGHDGPRHIAIQIPGPQGPANTYYIPAPSPIQDQFPMPPPYGSIMSSFRPRFPAFMSALSPKKQKISEILRPLLRKVRPYPGQSVGGQSMSDVPKIPSNAPYSGSHRPDNLDIIHLIANTKNSGGKPVTYHVNQLVTASGAPLSGTTGNGGGPISGSSPHRQPPPQQQLFRQPVQYISQSPPPPPTQQQQVITTYEFQQAQANPYGPNSGGNEQPVQYQIQEISAPASQQPPPPSVISYSSQDHGAVGALGPHLVSQQQPQNEYIEVVNLPASGHSVSYNPPALPVPYGGTGDHGSVIKTTQTAAVYDQQQDYVEVQVHQQQQPDQQKPDGGHGQYALAQPLDSYEQSNQGDYNNNNGGLKKPSGGGGDQGVTGLVDLGSAIELLDGTLPNFDYGGAGKPQAASDVDTNALVELISQQVPQLFQPAPEGPRGGHDQQQQQQYEQAQQQPQQPGPAHQPNQGQQYQVIEMGPAQYQHTSTSGDAGHQQQQYQQPISNPGPIYGGADDSSDSAYGTPEQPQQQKPDQQQQEIGDYGLQQAQQPHYQDPVQPDYQQPQQPQQEQVDYQQQQQQYDGGYVQVQEQQPQQQYTPQQQQEPVYVQDPVQEQQPQYNVVQQSDEQQQQQNYGQPQQNYEQPQQQPEYTQQQQQESSGGYVQVQQVDQEQNHQQTQQPHYQIVQQQDYPSQTSPEPTYFQTSQTIAPSYHQEQVPVYHQQPSSSDIDVDNQVQQQQQSSNSYQQAQSIDAISNNSEQDQNIGSSSSQEYEPPLRFGQRLRQTAGPGLVAAGSEIKETKTEKED